MTGFEEALDDVRAQMNLRDAVEHLTLRAARRCDQKHGLYWSLDDVSAVWVIARVYRAARNGKP